MVGGIVLTGIGGTGSDLTLEVSLISSKLLEDGSLLIDSGCERTEQDG